MLRATLKAVLKAMLKAMRRAMLKAMLNTTLSPVLKAMLRPMLWGTLRTPAEPKGGGNSKGSSVKRKQWFPRDPNQGHPPPALLFRVELQALKAKPHCDEN